MTLSENKPLHTVRGLKRDLFRTQNKGPLSKIIRPFIRVQKKGQNKRQNYAEKDQTKKGPLFSPLTVVVIMSGLGFQHKGKF